MKNYNFKSLTRTVLILFSGVQFSLVTSCSNIPANSMAVPSDAAAVLVVDTRSLIKKGNLDEIQDLRIFRSLMNEVRDESRGAYDIINNLVDDPFITGIKLKSDLLFYLVPKGEDEAYFYISAELKNKNKFQKLIEDLNYELRLDYRIWEQNDFNYVELAENEIILGWDNDKAIIIYSLGMESYADYGLRNAFKMNQNESFFSNSNFADFYKNKKDISLFLTSNGFRDMDAYKDAERELGYDLKDNYFMASINFEKGEIIGTAEFIPNDKIKNGIERNKLLENKFNEKLLKYLPMETFTSYSASINTKGLYDIIRNNAPNIIREFEDDTKISLREVLDSFGGSGLFSIYGFDNVEYTYTTFDYIFDESTANKLQSLYPISAAGLLSTEEKIALNKGETIEVTGTEYSINIKNVLSEGGDIDDAINYDYDINWFVGGWELKDIEMTDKEFIPLYGVVMDINDNRFIENVVRKIPEDIIEKIDDYYYLKDGVFPIYIYTNNEVAYITNDKKGVEDFSRGISISRSLQESQIASEIKKSNGFVFMNLNIREYPSEVEKLIKDGMGEDFKIFDKFLDAADYLTISNKNDYKVDLNLKIKDSSQNSFSFSKLLELIDYTYDQIRYL